MAHQSFFTRSQIVAIPIPWKIWKGIGERSCQSRMREFSTEELLERTGIPSVRQLVVETFY